MTAKQKQALLSEDPVFRTYEIENRLQRVNTLFTRVSSLPKPKEKKPAAGKKGKGGRGRTFKMDNVTINGNSGENLEDFIKFDNYDG